MNHKLTMFHHSKGYDVALCSCQQFGVYITTRELAEVPFRKHLDAVNDKKNSTTISHQNN